MKAKLLSFLVACGALGGLWATDPALAQKSGGVLRMPLGTSIASVSIHEESTIVVLGPMMGVFNNLVMFDQHVPQNTLSSIVSDLASSWSWSEDGKELTFKLRDGVKWHDGKPFTAADLRADSSIQDDCTYKLGNQCLLTQRMNRQAGRRSFSEKVAIYRGSDLKTTSSLAQYSEWNRANIDARQRILAALAPSVWRFQ